MKKLKVAPKAKSVELDDEDAPKKAKKVKAAARESDEDDEEEDDTDEDEEVLAESRPKTAKDRLRVPKASQQVVSSKKKLRLEKAAQEASEEDDEEDDVDARRAYLEDELAKLNRYGGVKLTPLNKSKFGKRDKNGLRRSSVVKASKGDDEEEMVKVTMIKTCDPSPRVGNCSVVMDHGHEKLEKNEMYQLPKSVALHLAETKYAILHDDVDSD